MQLNTAELNLVLEALNDREGVLSVDWEAASKANSIALVDKISAEMRDVRALAGKIANHLIVAKRLAA